MRNTQKWLALFALLLAFSACSKEENLNENPIQETRDVIFTTAIGGESYTRAANTAWDANDRIGVFMKSAGQTLSSSSILAQAENIAYTTTDRSTFNALNSAEKISYPANGSAVDFIAYYPYSTAVTSSFIYKVNVGDQSSQEAIDLLYSNNAVNQSKTVHESKLIFTHQLTKMRIVVEAGSGVSSLSGLAVNISGVTTTADFDLANGTLTTTNTANNTVALKVSEGEEGKYIAEALLIPDNGEVDRVITFTLPSGKNFKHKIAAGTKLDKNTRYAFTATLKDDNPVVEPTIGYVETPVMSNLPATQRYVLHMMEEIEGRNFAMLYDDQYRMAYWVAYPLVPSYHVKGTGRTDDWAYDPLVPQTFQPNLSTGFPAANTDRGHQIPSGDRTCGNAENRKTFYYTNMTAQDSRLNQGIWAELETKVRTWASGCDTMYVVTGAMVQTATDTTVEYTEDKSGNKVARPKYYFKALAQRKNDTYVTLAFKMNNETPPSNAAFNDYRLTVKELEAETGFTFFPAISDEVKSTIEKSKWY